MNMNDTYLDYPRDLIGYGHTPPHAQWPGQARIALQFVLNYEEGAENSVLHGACASETFLSEIIGAQAFPMRYMSMESLYEYGSRAGLWRLLRGSGCCRRSRALLLLRGTALRAGGGLGKDGILSQRQDQSGRQNCEKNYGKNGLHHVPLDCDQKLQTGNDSCLRGDVVAKKRLNLSNATPMPRPSAHTCMLV